MRRSARTLTVLVPCWNEGDVLPTLFARLEALRCNETRPITYAFLFVDDGSKDSSQSLIREYVQTRPYAHYIFLSRNFGKEQAMFAGIEHVDTDGMVIIDADLQDPPERIGQMADLWMQGYEDVYARRRTRQGEHWFKTATSHAYYALLQAVSNVEIQKDTGDFRLLDRKCVQALQRLGESERNSKALFSWIGFRKIEFVYDRDERVAGRTKWSFGKLVRLALDGITSFTTMPLRAATWLGGVISLISIAYALVITVRTLTTGIDVPGYASTMVVVLMLGGMQLLSLGVLGEYIARIFNQTKGRPNYLIEEDDSEMRRAA
ncbi:MAG: glycosyltransferase family 2 protein [Bifidobacterium sp.]|jgi:glycosyltransferase involved in cell wall biosynthesis|nr:glycosyltransferase family 2 protein [Bifidobacterium sp.]